MTAAWRTQLVAVHHKIVAMGGFDWALFNCNCKQPTDCAVRPPNATVANQECAAAGGVSPWSASLSPARGSVHAQCTTWLRAACTPAAPLAKQALFFGLTRQEHRTLVNASGQLPALMQDLASFLLVRGEYAWLGHGWTGNGNHYKGNWSPLFEVDYGTPLTDHCAEDPAALGVFRRSWSQAEVEMDCGAWAGKITMKNGSVLTN